MKIESSNSNNEDVSEFNKISLSPLIFDITLLVMAVLLIGRFNTQLKQLTTSTNSHNRYIESCKIERIYTQDDICYFDIDARDQIFYQIKVSKDQFLAYKVGDIVDIKVRGENIQLISNN